MKNYQLILILILLIGSASAADDLLPPNAKPGECYARVLVPPSYTETEKQIVKKEATEIIQLVPANYEWVEEDVLIKEASEAIKVIPATFKTIEEKIMVRPASKEIVSVATKYRTEEEQILVRPAYTTWKKGRGLIEKVDNATGEVMCLVEVPAKYKVIERQIIEAEPSTEVVEIPAEYKTIKKRVVDEPARTETIEVPAEYEKVKLQKLVAEATETRVKVAAQYQTVQESAVSKYAFMEWRSGLCETNTTKDVISRLQQSLAKAGHYKGPIDGIIGSATRTALTSYQDAKGFASGQLTAETLKSLGISI